MSGQGTAKGRAVRGLDHVVVMVDGIDAAQAAYERLGFQVQPRGFHRKLGTANHLMIFDTDYFEILGIVEDTEFNAERREWLKSGGGLANVALATDGADLAYEESGLELKRAIAEKTIRIRRDDIAADKAMLVACIVATFPLQLLRRALTGQAAGVWIKWRGWRDALAGRPIPFVELGLRSAPPG